MFSPCCFLLLLVIRETTALVPQLNVICQHMFASPYGCGGSSYDDSAMFLSSASSQRNSPDLLYYGNCNSQSLWVSTAGNDLGLIADAGVGGGLSNLTSTFIDRNGLKFYVSPYDGTQVPIKEGHIYAVLTMKDDFRALFYVEVLKYEVGGPLTINYAVKFYEVHEVVEQSPGFDWDIGNAPGDPDQCGKVPDVPFQSSVRKPQK